MTVLRCTAKLLKRLKQPAKPPEPAPQANPLGEWYADIGFWNRKPFVVMLNGTTGAVLVLNGNAAGLRILHERIPRRLCVCADSRPQFAGDAEPAQRRGLDAL